VPSTKPILAPEDPIGPGDPRSAWTSESVDQILVRHERSHAPVAITLALGIPTREVLEVIRRNCTHHDHLFNAVIHADLEG
jgi:hypothetical protein